MFDWTPAAIEQLKAMMADNNSSSEIGAALGCSRNAVIGKWHRLGLSGTEPRRKRKPRLPKQPRPKPIYNKSVIRILGNKPELVAEFRQVTREADVSPRHVRLIALEAGDCRYPFGEGAGITFCGCNVLEGLPYCEPHMRLTHRDEIMKGDVLAKWQRQYRKRAA